MTGSVEKSVPSLRASGLMGRLSSSAWWCASSLRVFRGESRVFWASLPADGALFCGSAAGRARSVGVRQAHVPPVAFRGSRQAHVPRTSKTETD